MAFSPTLHLSFPLRVLSLRSVVLSIAMDTKQASHTEPTTEEIKQWDEDELLGWIQQKRPKLLKGDDFKKLKDARIDGTTFLKHAGDVGFFENKCKLPIGTSERLADLAGEIAGGETASAKSKSLSFILCTPRRQQANNLTGPRRVNDAFKAGITYRLPSSLLSTSGVDWVFQPHPTLYEIIAPNVLDHYTRYKENHVDKTYAPIYFYLGGAGTGKSRHGSEFASSVQRAITLHTEHRLYHELAQRLTRAFVFHVSFENGTSLTPEEKSKPWSAVGTRMLHQLLGGHIEDISREYVATPYDVFRLVAAAENVDLYDDFTGILVIDGIQRVITWDSDRTNKDSVFYGFLNQIGDLSLISRHFSETKEGKLRRTPYIMTCATATYLGPARQFLAESHRKRVYLPLNRLDAPTWKVKNSKVLNDDPGTRLLVNDVGGHARAIETIADELAQYRNGFQPNITELADAVLFKLKDRYNEVVSTMGHDILPVAQCILSRQPIRLQETIPGSDLRWELITAPGLLWFEKIEEVSDSEYSYDGLGYLEAPYVWLWLFSRLLPPDIERICQFLTEWQFNDYQQLLHLQTGKGPTGKVIWQDFETFCCHFRILRSLGFGDGQELSFKRLHAGCKKLRDDENTMVVNQHLAYAEAAHRYSTKGTSVKDVVTKHIGTLDTDNQLFYVILNAPSAPAGDFFLSIRTPAHRSTSKGFRSVIVREVGQCKFVKEKLKKETYNQERSKSAGPDDFFVLYTTDETADDIVLPNRSGLVDESSWKSYFGPFAGRAFIASRYASSQVEER